jgi:peptide/nickel transport system substrate-binding protein/oligopeptide transport system substrate-binding protein
MRMGFSGVHKLSLMGALLLVATVSLLVAGCGPSSSGNVLPPSQQILRYALYAGAVDIKDMDPALEQDFYSYVPVSLVFPGLLVLDAQSRIQPWAASAMPTFDATSNTYTFKVRPGLRWSDGTPIDANTFAYSINRSLNPCTASTLTYYLFPIKDAAAFSTEACSSDGVSVTGKISSLIGDSITVPDSQTLVIKLSAPAPYFLQAMAYPTTYAQPKQLIDQYGLKNWTDHLADNGGFGGNLYKVKLWPHTGTLDLIANPSFWGVQPKLHEIDFHIYTASDPAFATYLDGGLDVGPQPPPASQYKAAKARADFHQVPFLDIEYLQPNWKKAPFDDVRVRQAFDLALNKQVLANQVLEGRSTATNHIVPQGMYGYNPNLTGPDGTTKLTGNVAKATALMQAYANDKCGGQLSRCPPVTLLNSNSPTAEVYSQAVLAMWQTAFPGYPLKTSFIDFTTLLNEVYSPSPPQLVIIGWAADYPDPQDWLSLQFSPVSINNTGFVNLPEANTLMAKADTDLNPITRAQEYNQAEQLLVNAGAWIPLYQETTQYNLQPYVHGLEYNSLGEIPMSSWQHIYLTTR